MDNGRGKGQRLSGDVATRPPHPPSTRVASLDQFRGFTVLAMFVVNFVGGLQNVPATLIHHHTYLSFADAVMPGFLFAVGFGLRASLLSRTQRVGSRAAYTQLARRGFGLVLLGVVVYNLTGGYRTWAELTAVPIGEALIQAFKRHPFEALTHIGVTVVWVLPVLGRSAWVRVLFAVASAGLHVWLSYAGYYKWNMTTPVGIDGGPLGFLTWTLPLVAGTLAHDWVTANTRAAGWCLLLGVALVGFGTALAMLNNRSATPPFVPPTEPIRDYWLMSQRAGSVPYLLAGAGVAAMGYAGFRLVTDRFGYKYDLLDLLGRHALAGYLIHDPVSSTVRPFCPNDAPGLWVAVCMLVYLAITIGFLRYLDRNKLVLKV